MGLSVRGVSYAVDGIAAESVRDDLQVIRDDLHCTTVMMIGINLDSLIDAAGAALEAGLDVYVRPFLSGASTRQLIAHLGRAAVAAEELRRRHPGRVTLVVGNELSLTTKVVVPVGLELVRLRILLRFRGLLRRRTTRRVNALLRDLVRAARVSFGGPLTYAAAMWETIDWSDMDIVGGNLYRVGNNPSAYERRIRTLVGESDKPVVVTEFGCGAHVGADLRGPGSFLIVNWFASPPRVREGHTRDESVQARYLGELIDLYADAGVHGCFVFTFHMPDFPYDPDPRRDLDMAGFGVVRIPGGQRKEAFATVAQRYAAR